MHEPIAFSCLATIIVTCWVSYLGFRSAAFEEKYIFCPERILGCKEFHRIFSSGFLHADGRHLLFNMISLYFFGSDIELMFGARQFLFIYFSAIIGGSLLSLFIHRYHEYKAYGASGGVCGMIFAHIFLFPGGSISGLFIPIGIPSWLYALLFLAASFYGMKTRKDNVGHDAHLGGALIGLFVTATLHPWIIRSSPKLFAAISVGSLLLFVYLAKNPLFLPLSAVIPGSRKRSNFTFFPKGKEKAFNVDALLDKIATEGLHSLSQEEHDHLKKVSDKFRRRAETKEPESKLVL